MSNTIICMDTVTPTEPYSDHQSHEFALRAAHDQGETGGASGSKEPFFGKSPANFHDPPVFAPLPGIKKAM